MQQGDTGRLWTPGGCSEDTASVHGVDALPAELPERPHVYYLMNKNSFPARVVVCCLQPQLVSEEVLGAPFVSTDIW